MRLLILKNKVKGMSGIHKKDFNFQYISTMIRCSAIVLHTCSKQDFRKWHLRGSWHINVRDNAASTSSWTSVSTTVDRTKLYQKLKNRLRGYPESTCIILIDNNNQVSNITKILLETLGYNNVAILGGTEIEPLLSVMQGKTKVKGLDICQCKHYKK